MVLSNHHPLLTSVNVSNIVVNNEESDNVTNKSQLIKWDTLSNDDRLMYRNNMENTLSNVEINHDMITRNVLVNLVAMPLKTWTVILLLLLLMQAS